MTPQQRLAIDFIEMTGLSRDERLLIARFVCQRNISSFKDLVPVEIETLRAFAEAWALTRTSVTESDAQLFTIARLEGMAA